MQRRIAGLMLLVTLAACAQQETDETQVAVDTAMTAPAPAADQLLDPNSATPEELATVPGVDSTLAAQIVALSRFAVACGDSLQSVDINPFIALPASRGGGCAVDAVVVGHTPLQEEPA